MLARSRVALHGAHRRGGCRPRSRYSARVVLKRRSARRCSPVCASKVCVDREAAARRRRSPGAAPGAAPTCRSGRSASSQPRDRARHADAQARRSRASSNGERLAGRAIERGCVGPKAAGAVSRRVDRRHPAGGGAVDRHEAAAADAGRVGSVTPSTPARGHGRVDRVGAARSAVGGRAGGGRVHAWRRRRRCRSRSRPWAARSGSAAGERHRRDKHGAQRHARRTGVGTTTTHPGLLRLVLARRLPVTRARGAARDRASSGRASCR